MAGSCKPNIQGLGRECRYKVIDWMDYYKKEIDGNSKVCGLFDGNANARWNSQNVFYLIDTYPFLEVEVYSRCNIWRSGCDDDNSAKLISKLKIEKYDNGNYIDITNNIKQQVSQIGSKQWEKTIENLPKGRYRFSLNGNRTNIVRMDSEWYLESVDNSKYIAKKQEDYYVVTDGKISKLSSKAINKDVYIGQGFDLSSENLNVVREQIGDNFKLLRLKKDD